MLTLQRQQLESGQTPQSRAVTSPAAVRDVGAASSRYAIGDQSSKAFRESSTGTGNISGTTDIAKEDTGSKPIASISSVKTNAEDNMEQDNRHSVEWTDESTLPEHLSTNSAGNAASNDDEARRSVLAALSRVVSTTPVTTVVDPPAVSTCTACSDVPSLFSARRSLESVFSAVVGVTVCSDVGTVYCNPVTAQSKPVSRGSGAMSPSTAHTSTRVKTLTPFSRRSRRTGLEDTISSSQLSTSKLTPTQEFTRMDSKYADETANQTTKPDSESNSKIPSTTAPSDALLPASAATTITTRNSLDLNIQLSEMAQEITMAQSRIAAQDTPAATTASTLPLPYVAPAKLTAQTSATSMPTLTTQSTSTKVTPAVQQTSTTGGQQEPSTHLLHPAAASSGDGRYRSADSIPERTSPRPRATIFGDIRERVFGGKSSTGSGSGPVASLPSAINLHHSKSQSATASLSVLTSSSATAATKTDEKDVKAPSVGLPQTSTQPSKPANHQPVVIVESSPVSQRSDSLADMLDTIVQQVNQLPAQQRPTSAVADNSGTAAAAAADVTPSNLQTTAAAAFEESELFINEPTIKENTVDSTVPASVEPTPEKKPMEIETQAVVASDGTRGKELQMGEQNLPQQLQQQQQSIVAVSKPKVVIKAEVPPWRMANFPGTQYGQQQATADSTKIRSQPAAQDARETATPVAVSASTSASEQTAYDQQLSAISQTSTPQAGSKVVPSSISRVDWAKQRFGTTQLPPEEPGWNPTADRRPSGETPPSPKLPVRLAVRAMTSVAETAEQSPPINVQAQRTFNSSKIPTSPGALRRYQQNVPGPALVMSSPLQAQSSAVTADRAQLRVTSPTAVSSHSAAQNGSSKIAIVHGQQVTPAPSGLKAIDGSTDSFQVATNTAAVCATQPNSSSHGTTSSASAVPVTSVTTSGTAHVGSAMSSVSFPELTSRPTPAVQQQKTQPSSAPSAAAATSGSCFALRLPSPGLTTSATAATGQTFQRSDVAPGQVTGYKARLSSERIASPIERQTNSTPTTVPAVNSAAVMTSTERQSQQTTPYSREPLAASRPTDSSQHAQTATPASTRRLIQNLPETRQPLAVNSGQQQQPPHGFVTGPTLFTSTASLSQPLTRSQVTDAKLLATECAAAAAEELRLRTQSSAQPVSQQLQQQHRSQQQPTSSNSSIVSSTTTTTGSTFPSQRQPLSSSTSADGYQRPPTIATHSLPPTLTEVDIQPPTVNVVCARPALPTVHAYISQPAVDEIRLTAVALRPAVVIESVVPESRLVPIVTSSQVTGNTDQHDNDRVRPPQTSTAVASEQNTVTSRSQPIAAGAVQTGTIIPALYFDQHQAAHTVPAAVPVRPVTAQHSMTSSSTDRTSIQRPMLAMTTPSEPATQPVQQVSIASSQRLPSSDANVSQQPAPSIAQRGISAQQQRQQQQQQPNVTTVTSSASASAMPVQQRTPASSEAGVSRSAPTLTSSAVASSMTSMATVSRSPLATVQTESAHRSSRPIDTSVGEIPAEKRDFRVDSLVADSADTGTSRDTTTSTAASTTRSSGLVSILKRPRNEPADAAVQPIRSSVPTVSVDPVRSLPEKETASAQRLPQQQQQQPQQQQQQQKASRGQDLNDALAELDSIAAETRQLSKSLTTATSPSSVSLLHPGSATSAGDRAQHSPRGSRSPEPTSIIGAVTAALDARMHGNKAAHPKLASLHETRSLDRSGIARRQLEQLTAPGPSVAIHKQVALRQPRPLRKAQTVDLTGLGVGFGADRDLLALLASRKEKSASDDEEPKASSRSGSAIDLSGRLEEGEEDEKMPSVAERIQKMETKKIRFSVLREKAAQRRMAQSMESLNGSSNGGAVNSPTRQQQPMWSSGSGSSRDESQAKLDRLACFAAISDTSVGQKRRQLLQRRHLATGRRTSEPVTFEELNKSQSLQSVNAFNEQVHKRLTSRSPAERQYRQRYRWSWQKQSTPCDRIKSSKRSQRRRSLPTSTDVMSSAGGAFTSARQRAIMLRTSRYNAALPARVNAVHATVSSPQVETPPSGGIIFVGQSPLSSATSNPWSNQTSDFRSQSQINLSTGGSAFRPVVSATAAKGPVQPEFGVSPTFVSSSGFTASSPPSVSSNEPYGRTQPLSQQQQQRVQHQQQQPYQQQAVQYQQATLSQSMSVQQQPQLLQHQQQRHLPQQMPLSIQTSMTSVAPVAATRLVQSPPAETATTGATLLTTTSRPPVLERSRTVDDQAAVQRKQHQVQPIRRKPPPTTLQRMDSLDDDEFDKMVEVNIRQLSDNGGSAVASSTTATSQSTSAVTSKRMPTSSSQHVASQSPRMSRRPLLQHSQTVAGYHPEADNPRTGRMGGVTGGPDLQQQQQYQQRQQPPQHQQRYQQQQQQQKQATAKDEESEDELSRLSLADKLKLFSTKKSQTVTSSSSSSGSGAGGAKANRRQLARFQTQPVTWNELEQAVPRSGHQFQSSDYPQQGTSGQRYGGDFDRRLQFNVTGGGSDQRHSFYRDF